MRKTYILGTVLITSFVMALAGLIASPIASASEDNSVRVSTTFQLGSSALTKVQKAAIKKSVTTAGTNATFLVTGASGKLPGVSDSMVQLLAKKRAQAVESYLVKLGVNQASVTTKVKITRPGIVPKTKILGTLAVPALTVASATQATTPVTPVALACAAGGTCVVGDKGPGGGNVFYVAIGTFNCGLNLASTCKYLEAAPSGWNNNGVAANDPPIMWASTFTNQSTAVSGADGTAIGTGYQNSVDIENQGNNVAATSAAVAARAYTGGSKSDWHLPSKDELNQMCKWANAVPWNSNATVCTAGAINSGTGPGLGAAGFASSYYWSSSEDSNAFASSQTFSNGLQYPGDKYIYLPVRPIRAF